MLLNTLGSGLKDSSSIFCSYRFVVVIILLFFWPVFYYYDNVVLCGLFLLYSSIQVICNHAKIGAIQIKINNVKANQRGRWERKPLCSGTVVYTIGPKVETICIKPN